MATSDCENFQCCCCLDDLTDIDTSITKCGHRMHTSCLIKWVSSGRNKTCPLCRSNMIEDDDDETNPPSSIHQISPSTIMNELNPVVTTILNHIVNITNDHIPINETNEHRTSRPRSIVHTLIRNPDILNSINISSIASRFIWNKLFHR